MLAHLKMTMWICSGARPRKEFLPEITIRKGPHDSILSFNIFNVSNVTGSFTKVCETSMVYLIIHCDYMGILRIARGHFQRKGQTEGCIGSILV